MMRPPLIAFLPFLNLGLATSDPKRTHVHLFRRLNICTENNFVACDSSCMPLGSVCCYDGSGSFCRFGNFCDGDGCCPVHKKCTGPGGTVTFDVLTGAGTFPTSPPKITGHGRANSFSTTFGSDTVFPQATGVAPAGSSHQPKSCDASILDWIALTVTIVSVHITWWLFDLPKLWKHELRDFLDAICWQCLRISMPSVAGIYAVYHAVELPDLPKIYYYGFGPDEERQRMTPFEYVKALITDTLSVIATCVTIFRVCHLKPDEYGEIDSSGWNARYFVYPTLPVALIGFWLLAVPRLKLGNIWLIFIGGFFVLAIPCVAFSLILYYLSPSQKGDLWFMATFNYIYLSLPLAFIPHVGFQLLIPAVSVFARTGGIALGAMSEDASFPFCQLRNRAFGWTYLSFGILAALLAIYGRFKWDRVRYVFIPRSEWGNRKAKYRPRHDLSRHAVIPESKP